jgi:alpha-L-rhamnosidase
MRSAALSAILITNTLLAACGQTAAAPSGAYSPAVVSDVTVNYMKEPLGIRTDEPLTFSWKLASDVTGEKQDAARIRIEKEKEDGGREEFYDSGLMRGSDSVGVTLNVPGLEKETVYFCTVTVQADKGGESVSEETAFVTEADLTGVSFITPDLASGGAMPLFRAEKKLSDKKIVRALLYASALGTMNVSVNGQDACRTGGQAELLAPGWTDYKYNTDMRTYDVTDLVTGPELTVGAEIGNGWYSGIIGRQSGYESCFGPDDQALEPGFIAKLIVRYEDGTTEALDSGEVSIRKL